MSVTETDVIIDGQAAIPISSINNVTAYGSVNPILPIIFGAGCGYLGIIGGVIVGFIMSSETIFSEDAFKVGTVAYLGGGIGAVSGYTMVYKGMASRSQNIVPMESWTFEKKRNFLLSALKKSTFIDFVTRPYNKTKWKL